MMKRPKIILLLALVVCRSLYLRHGAFTVKSYFTSIDIQTNRIKALPCTITKDLLPELKVIINFAYISVLFENCL